MKQHHAELEREQIAVAVRAAFSVRFEHDGERGGHLVRCKELPEVDAHGATLTLACADASRKIVSALERRAEAGEAVPRLIYLPPLPWSKWRRVRRD